MNTTVSAEIRWFWRTTPPAGLEDWFCKPEHHLCVAGGGQARTDAYLLNGGDPELGIKRRGDKPGVELKGLVACQDTVAVGPFAGPIQIWAKWTSAALNLEGNATVKTEKLRWLRNFDTAGPLPLEIPLGEDLQPRDGVLPPSRGCNVELNRVTLSGRDVCWTLGFEAFGTIRTVEDDLRKVATALAARWQAACLDGLLASYPEWLQEYTLKGD